MPRFSLLYCCVVPETIKGFRADKLSTLRPVGEFFDYQRISRPADLNEATQVSTQRHIIGKASFSTLPSSRHASHPGSRL